MTVPLKTAVENEAVSRLTHLLAEFRRGAIKPGQLAALLKPVVELLIDDNPKAAILYYLIRLEALICTHSEIPYPEEVREKAKEILDHIAKQITPALPDHKAFAVAQGLAQIIEFPELLSDPLPSLQHAFEGWLKPYRD